MRVIFPGQCSRNRLSRPVDGLDPPTVTAEAEQVTELEERPGHGPDPRFLWPTANAH
jgi:hypothetical protein